METISQQVNEELQRQERVGKFVWEQLSNEIVEGERTPDQAQVFYETWFPDVPHAA